MSVTPRNQPADATHAGQITTVAQTIAGVKTFSASIIPSGGIVGNTSGVLQVKEYVGGVLEFTDTGVSILVQASPTHSTNYAITGGPTITVPAGNWLILYKIAGDVTTSSTGAVFGIRAALYEDSSPIDTATSALLATSSYRYDNAAGSKVVSIPSQKVYTLRIGLSQLSGSTTYSNLNYRIYSDVNYSYIRAIRLP